MAGLADEPVREMVPSDDGMGSAARVEPEALQITWAVLAEGIQGAAEVSAHPFAVEIMGLQETMPRDHHSSVAWRVEMTWSRVYASWGLTELCSSRVVCPSQNSRWCEIQ